MFSAVVRDFACFVILSGVERVCCVRALRAFVACDCCVRCCVLRVRVACCALRVACWSGFFGGLVEIIRAGHVKIC